jgi:2-polyprenyl-3-methyl-5-hydroxy-6-metoxy-1,4-benzoquinol methylase
MNASVKRSADPIDHEDQRATLTDIIHVYDRVIVRAYCVVRFVIININMLHILTLCMRGKRRILEVGSGFGLFGCYFASRWPDIVYHGIDVDAGRVKMAQAAAQRLGLSNARFVCGDATGALELEDQYDAVVMMDLLHHLPDPAKRKLLDATTARLRPGGHLIIKDVTRKPAWKMAFTWLLDVLMTRGFDMWYWDRRQFREAVDPSFALETYPISDWLPYPHVVYLFSKPDAADERRS